MEDRPEDLERQVTLEQNVESASGRNSTAQPEEPTKSDRCMQLLLHLCVCAAGSQLMNLINKLLLCQQAWIILRGHSERH